MEWHAKKCFRAPMCRRPPLERRACGTAPSRHRLFVACSGDAVLLQEVVALAFGTAATLSGHAAAWTALSRFGILRAVCEPRCLTALGDVDDTHLETQLACLLTTTTSKARGRRLWRQENVALLLSRLLKTRNNAVAIDAALCALNFFSHNDVDVVWDAVAVREPFEASLRVMVQALKRPQPRAMRCIIATLCALVGPVPPAVAHIVSIFNFSADAQLGGDGRH